MSRTLAVLAVLAATSASAWADRPLPTYVMKPAPPGTSAAVSSNVIFMDRCASGCRITRGGSDDSRTDTTSIVGSGTLAAFSCGDAAWGQVMACMQDVFRDYNVVITDVDPGTANHLEIKVAGTPQNVGLGNGVGGIAPFYCQSYQSNALVFDFANIYGCATDEICATAAQEIAHTWSLDHVINAADPMTYYPYGSRRFYSDNTQCGSDCTDSSGRLCSPGTSGCRSPSGASCTTNQTHPCTCTGNVNQSDNAAILALFGAGNPTPPTVKIVKPLDGAAVAPGFPVQADVTSPYGISKVELRVDGNLVGSITSTPYVFNAPDTLQPGQHTVQVTGYDSHNLTGMTQINAIIGNPCQKAADCPDMTETCIGGRCVPGSGVPGGLGSPCKAASDCLEGECASDGTNMYCTSDCTAGQCPSGFGCLPSGGSGSDPSAGVCWPNYNDGTGGGGCSTGGGAPLTLGLLLLGLAMSRRRKR